MAFWRVKAFAVFDTAAHRDAAAGQIAAAGGTARGRVTLHRCTHDEEPGSCRTPSLEVD